MLGRVKALDPDDPRPAYQQVGDRFRAAIKTGTLPPGSQLPSHRELSEEFGVAMETVKRALNELRAEGLIVTRQGKGTFVRTEVGTPADSADRSELAQLKTQVAEHARRLDEIERRIAGG
jgi:DNA-binding GntR family transcriptional regulator